MCLLLIQAAFTQVGVLAELSSHWQNKEPSRSLTPEQIKGQVSSQCTLEEVNYFVQHICRCQYHTYFKFSYSCLLVTHSGVNCFRLYLFKARYTHLQLDFLPCYYPAIFLCWNSYLFPGLIFILSLNFIFGLGIKIYSKWIENYSFSLVRVPWTKGLYIP